MKHFSILHTVTSSNWDEQAIRVLAELEGFRTRGCAVALVAQPTSEIFKRAVEREIPVEAVAMDRPNVPQAIWQIMRIIRKRQVDIVNTHASRDHLIGAVAARLSGRRPIVVKTKYHSALLEKGFMSRLLYQWLSDCVITMGEASRRQLIAKHHFLPERIVSIPTGVDLNLFDPNRYDPERTRSELGYSSGPLIGIIGAFMTWKGHEDFVAMAGEVLKTIPDARFYIVGTGVPKDVQHVRKAISHYGLQAEVFLLGYREDIPQILSAIDLLVHCSNPNEGIPQAVLQALAMEKPVVATKVEAIPEAVFDGINGYLVPPRDIRALSNRVGNLLQDDLKRKAFGQAGRRLVNERYSMEGMLDRIEKLYDGLLAIGMRND